MLTKIRVFLAQPTVRRVTQLVRIFAVALAAQPAVHSLIHGQPAANAALISAVVAAAEVAFGGETPALIRFVIGKAPAILAPLHIHLSPSTITDVEHLAESIATKVLNAQPNSTTAAAGKKTAPAKPPTAK